MTLRVLITAKSVASNAAALGQMRDAGFDLVIREGQAPFDEDAVVQLVRETNPDAIVFTMEPTTRRVIDAAPNLKIIARPAVGFDTVDLDACRSRRIPVATSPVNDESVADFAMGLLLNATRHIGETVNSVNRGGWDKPVGIEVWGKTITIVGLGRIGKNLARRARGFDMRILAVDAYHDAAFAKSYGVEYVDLGRGLAEADFISLHAPLTPETADMINAATIETLKSGAFIINTARAGLIDEAALAKAVMSGRLGGAAVDVIRTPGAGSKSPLVGVPGIQVTTHIATFSREAIARVAGRVASNVVAALQGRRPENVVNPEVYDQ